MFSGVIVNEAVLGLLGLGIQPPDSGIGKMITDAIPYLEITPLQVFLPSLVLVVIVLGVSFLGEVCVIPLILRAPLDHSPPVN